MGICTGVRYHEIQMRNSSDTSYPVFRVQMTNFDFELEGTEHIKSLNVLRPHIRHIRVE